MERLISSRTGFLAKSFNLSSVCFCFDLSSIMCKSKLFLNFIFKGLVFVTCFDLLCDMAEKNKKPKKICRVQAYVTEDTKAAIIKLAEEQERSESYVAGNILNKGVKKT